MVVGKLSNPNGKKIYSVVEGGAGGSPMCLFSNKVLQTLSSKYD